ncbi:MAG: efflux RND transporter permease subunit [Candidatus Competibacteraceae bacterium]|nr:MAG: efflux RND transporter permease subunit [Candidatus Competibacteraceae bacterium]
MQLPRGRRPDSGYFLARSEYRQRRRRPRANTLEVSRGVRAEVERIRPQLPESVRMTVATDDAIFIWSSIVEVLKTLLSSLITLFLTPVLYHLLAGFTQPVNAIQQRLTAQLHDAARDAPQAVGAAAGSHGAASAGS